MAATEDSLSSQLADETPVQLDPNVDINHINDEDLLRKLWQATEDFADKRRIRARMYKLREKRLKDFYNCDDVLGEAPSSRSESPFMMMEAQTAPESCQVSSVSSVTSYSYSSSGPAEVSVEMEVDESTSGDGTVRSSVRRESRRQTTEQNKRRSNDEEDAVSEKIRRKSSERTKRYQQIMSEITSSDAEAMDQQPSTAAEAEGLGFSSEVTMESSQTADKNADEDVSIQKVNNRTTTTRTSTVETTTHRSERRSSAGPKVVEESTSQRTSSSEGSKGTLTTTSPGCVIVRSLESSSSTQSPLIELSGHLAEENFSQELKKTSSRREMREGDIITEVEVTETWRRVREAGHSEPITQRVTVTKTIRKRADGTLLEENEDEVIDDLDSASEGQMITAVDALLSSVTSAKTLPEEPDEVQEETIVAEKTFLCGEAEGSSAPAAPAVDVSLEESIEREIEEYRQVAAEEVSQAAEIETDVKEEQVCSPEVSDLNEASCSSAAEEEVTAESTEESTPRKLAREQTKLTIKRTTSQSPSRITKRRPDGTVVTKEVEVSPGKKTTTTTTTSSSSRTVGGVKQTNNSTTVSRVSTARSGLKENNKSVTSSIPKLNSSTTTTTTTRKRTERSESSELKSLPARKTSNGTSEVADESVDEFVKLEQQLEKESTVQDEAEEKYSRDILSRPSVLQLDKSYRSLKESTAVDRSPSPSSIKRLGLKSSIPSASSPTSSKKSTVTDSLKSSASVKSQSNRSQSPLVSEQRKVTSVETRVTKKSPTSSIPRTSSTARTTSTSRQTESKSRVSELKPGAVIRTVEVTRTVAVREDDKPWRTNSKKEVTKTVYGSGRKGLHGNVMNVVEKYVDTDGCAIHGSHGHSEEQSVDESSPREPEEEEERPESLSPPPLIDPKNLDDQPADEEEEQEVEEEAEEFPEPPSAEEIGVDSGLVEPANGVDDAELVEVEESVDARYREPLSSARQTATESATVFERIRDETSDTRERPSLLFSKDRPPSPSKEKLLAASPVLGSPSVVMKARSLFDTEKSEESPVTERKSSATTESSSRQSISKIRSAFESPRSGSGQSKISESTRTEVRTVTSTLRRSSSKDDKSIGKLKNSFEKPAEEAAPEAPVEEAVPVPEPVAPAPVPEPSNDVEMEAPAETAKSGQVIEEIEDLTLLENMLNTATSYDDRSRVRAQIRIVRKKLGLTGVMPSSASSSPMLQRRNVTTTVQTTGTSGTGSDTTRLTRSSFSSTRRTEESEKRTSSDVTDADSVKKEPESSAVAAQKTSITRVESVVESGEPITVEIDTDNSSRRSSSARIISRKSTEITTITKRSSQTSLKTSSTTEEVVQSAPAITSSEETAVEDTPTETEESESVTSHRTEVTRKGPEDEIREQLEKASPVKNNPWRKMIEKSESSSSVEEKSGNVTTRTLTSKKSQSELKIWARLPEPEQPAATLDITSSYGTGPMDEYGKPLFGLGALRRRQPKPAVIEDSVPSTPPQPIIIERSQTLNELQKLHEQQQVQKEVEPPPSADKPRAKLRDTFTTPSYEETDETDSSLSDREPIISERSQALKDIIRRHEHVTTDIAMVTEPPPSPKPKAKLKDSFVSTELTANVEDSREPLVERSESFQTIIKRHQELSQVTQSSTSSVPTPPASPVKRPGILKKPKDWSPSPQELPSPAKEDTRKSTEETTTTTTSTTATTTTIPRKQSIEIQLNPVDNHLVVVQEVPDAEVVRRSSVITTYTTSSINTIQLRSQEEEDTVKKSTPAGRITDREESAITSSRKSSIEIEPIHKATATWSTGKASAEPTVSSPRHPLKVEEPEIVSSAARTSGRFVRATSKTAEGSESGNLVSRLSSRFSRTNDSDKSTDGESKTSRLIGRFSTRSRDGDSSVTKTTETSTKVTEDVSSSVGSRLNSRIAAKDTEEGSVTTETTTKVETSAASANAEAESPATPRSSRFGSRTTTTTESVTKTAESSKMEEDEPVTVAPATPRSSRFGSRTTTTTESVTKTAESSKMEDDEPVTVTSRLSRFGSRNREADTASTTTSTTTSASTSTLTSKTTESSKMEEDEPAAITSRLSRFGSIRSRATDTASTTTDSTKTTEAEAPATPRSSRFGSRTTTTTESVTKTAESSKMEEDEPVTVTSRLSSRFSSRTRDADSTASSAAVPAATETTTKTVETASKMEEDEYIPVTSRLSSRFGSRSRTDGDSVSTKTTVTSSKTEESEYVPVTSRLSSRFSSRNRQDAESSAKTEVEEVKTSPRAPFKLTGDSTGHTLNSTSTFQLQTSTTSAASEAASDSASHRSKASPREPSVPRDDDSTADARSVKTRQELQELSVATRAEVALLTRQSSESGDGLIKEKSRKFSGEPTQRAPPELKTTGKLPASRYVLQRQESLKLENRIKTMPAGASVRALAQRFQTTTETETPQRKTSSGSYPKAGLIFRSSSFRQSASPDRETVRSNVSMVQRSESLRTSSPRIRNRASMERQSQEREETSVQSETTEVTSGAATPRDSQISTPRSVTTTERRSYQTTTVKSSDSPPDVNQTSVSVELSPSKTVNSSVTTTTTTTKSFLEDRTPVRGMQDIIGRMKADTNGTTNEDDRALSLLNKFLGAQILVQCTEPLVNSQTPDVVETVTTSQHLSEDGKSLTRSTTANRAGSQHQVTSGSDDQGRTWKQETSSSVSATKTLSTTNRLDDNLPGSMAQPCIVDGVDINTCDDDFKLNELLDNCNDYDTRCKLRARIKSLLNNPKADGPTVSEMAAVADDSDLNVATASSSCSSSSCSASSRSSSSRKKHVQRSQSTSSASSSSTASSASSASSAGPTSPAVVVSLPLSSLLASGSQPSSVEAPTDRVIAWVSKGLDSLPGAQASEQSTDSGDSSAGHQADAAALVMVMEDSAGQSKCSSSDKEGNSAGELFDSGTESGEDTTKSNHSEPDLTSFMENLKLSLDMNQCTAPVAHSANSAASKQSNDNTSDSRMSLNSSGGEEFLTQVDVVLNRLKTSLQTDVTSPAPSDDRLTFPSDNQEFLHEYIASGGLNHQQPWEVGTMQRNELIGLIDRLQSSLHDLQRRSSTTTPSPSPALAPQSLPAPDSSSEPTKEVAPSDRNRTNCAPATSPVPPSTDDAPLVKNKNLSWRADFLKPAAKPVSSRPIWCRRDSDAAAPSAAKSTIPASRVLLETPGVRGRFVHQPCLQPAPKVTAKPTPRTVIPPPKLPSFILTKESRSPDRKAEPVTCGTLTVQVNRNEQQGLVLKVGQPNSSGMNGTVCTAVSNETTNNSVDSQDKTPPKVEDGDVGTSSSEQASASPTKTERKARADIPWKVKLAKKKAERSQTSQLEGSLSVDLRKCIHMAAQRKSVEDLFSVNAASGPDDSQKEEPVSPIQAHPILKQKSMSDLYNSRPKPFERSGSVGGIQRTQVKAVQLNASIDKTESGSEPDESGEKVSLAQRPDVPSADQAEASGLSTSARSTATQTDEVMPPTISRAPLRRQTAVENAQVGPSVAKVEASEVAAAAKTTSVNIQSSVRFTDDQLVTTGILRMSSSADAQPPKTSVPSQECQGSANVQAPRRFSSSISFETSPVTTPTTETAVSKTLASSIGGQLSDPSEKLFTASESIQIAIHKAAINKQISEEEARRRGEPPTPDAVDKLTTPLSKFQVQFVKDNASDERETSESPVAQISAKVVDSGHCGAAVAKPLAQKKDLFKERARRSNTIAIPQPSTTQASDGFTTNQTSKPFTWKPASTCAPVDFVAKTENDKKFQNFLNKTAGNTANNVQSVKLAFQPAVSPQTGQVGMWTNKFSNIRSTFEAKAEADGNRSRRSSGDPVTTGNLKVEIVNDQPTKTAPLFKVETKTPSVTQLFSSKAIAAACASAAAAAASRTQPAVKPAKPNVSLAKAEPARQQATFKPVAAPVANVSAVKSQPAAAVERQPSNDSESAMHVILDASQGRLTVKSGPAPVSSSSAGPDRSAALSSKNAAASSSPVKSGPMETKQNQVATAAASATRSETVKSINSHGGAQLPAIARLRNERSCSSVRTVDSTHSGSKDDDDDKDGEYGDDEASSTSSSSESSSESSDASSDEDDEPPPSPPKKSAIQNLSNIVQKFASMDDVTSFLHRENIPVVAQEPLEVKLSLAPPLPPRLNVMKPIAPAPVTAVDVGSSWQPEVVPAREKKLEPPAPPVRFSSPSIMNKWVAPTQAEPPAKVIPAGLKTGIVKSFSTHVFNKDEPPHLPVPAFQPLNASYGISRTKSAASSLAMSSQSFAQPKASPAVKFAPEASGQVQTPNTSQSISRTKSAASSLAMSPQIAQPKASPAVKVPPEASGQVQTTNTSQSISRTKSAASSLAMSSQIAQPKASPVVQVTPEASGSGTHVARKEAMTLNGLQPNNESSLSPVTAVRSRSLSAQRTYLEPAGPTLVGLVASNVSVGSSRNVSSIVSSAQSFAPTLDVASSQDYSPTSSIMKSVSSSRLISGAKEQLSKKDCPLVASRPRPQSLILPANKENGIDHHPSPDRRSSSVVRTATTIGTKQFEAFLSPDSAEKKQREIMQFFAMASANPSNSSSLAPKVTSSAAKSGHQSETCVKMRFKAHQSAASSGVQRPRAVSEGAALNEDIQLDDLISDVDEVFEKLLGDTDSLKRGPKSRPEASRSLEMVDVPASPNGQSGAGKSKFADRRRAWEESSSCKLHINQAAVYNLQASCPADAIKPGRNFGSTVVTQNQVVTRQTTTRTGQSAFAKFQQLDKSTKPSPSSSPNGRQNKNIQKGGGIQSASFGVKDILLQWCQFHTRAYKNVRIENFSTSWNDGMAFCALIHHFYPDAFDFDQLDPSNKSYNFELAFKTADEKAGIAPLLDVEDMVLMPRPDWKCVFTYVQSFYRRFELKDKEPVIVA